MQAPPGSAKSHVQIVAGLNIAAGALYLLIGIVVFLFLGAIGGIVAAQGEPGAGGIIAMIAGCVSIFLMVLGLPSIIAGWGLFLGKEWARILTIVLAILHLFNVPIGTALGVYTLWVLLADEPASPPAESLAQ
jgi:hypothetical protein